MKRLKNYTPHIIHSFDFPWEPDSAKCSIIGFSSHMWYGALRRKFNFEFIMPGNITPFAVWYIRNDKEIMNENINHQ